VCEEEDGEDEDDGEEDEEDNGGSEASTEEVVVDIEAGRGSGDSRIDTAADWRNDVGAERDEAPRTITWRCVDFRAERI
jgi:hypothetical protein